MLKQAMQLAQIPEESYVDYRYDAIFHAYKWDPQVEDQNTVSKHVLLMNKETATQLETWAEALAKETVEMEQELLHNKKLAKKLGLPTQVYKALDGMQNYDSEKHVRLMRFDFHPTVEGWAVSEVNSDVPGGLAEATALPQIAAKYFNGFIPHKHIGAQLYTAFQKRAGDHANIAFVHATSYADDRQVMQFLGDYFDAKGFHSSYIAPDHIRFVNEEAINIAEGEEGELDGIVRFFPLEWLVNLPKHSKWKGYYSTKTTSCNHPIAIFAQSKRLPLIWNELDCDIQTHPRTNGMAFHLQSVSYNI